MLKHHRFTLVGSIALLTLLVPRLVAQNATYKGTVAAVDKAKVQVLTDGSDPKKSVWFAVTEKTKVTRGGKTVAFDAANIKVGEALSITVAKGDEAHTDWTCSMHPQVSKPEAGKCPLCSMALKERQVPAGAAEIRLGER
jgi:hypothetical protein